MTQNLTDFLTDAANKKYATQNGTKIHAKLKSIVIDDVYGNSGDDNIINQILNTPNLSRYFSKSAQTEVPIAGVINGVFISRRIDRLLINDAAKTIEFIDYKSDTNKNTFIEQYKHQLNEYAKLLKSAYPDYIITGGILWTQDWQYNQIISL
jgi:hypothetical protein